jgi:cob(I)alamin adenosyltransferase
MGHRLSRIVTRTGDDGSTGLADGQRVAKESLRIEAGGSVDELNCALGLLLADNAVPADMATALTECQHDLFDLGGELAIPGSVAIGASHVQRLEDEVERLNTDLPPLKEFVLPGGGSAAAACHLARAICRRAERRCWQLSRSEAVGAESLRYLNRLSDLLFVMARALARQQRGSEVMWKRQR